MKIKQLIKILISLAIISTNISCDQITKEKVRAEIETNEIIEVVGDNVILTKVENSGAALSIGQDLSPNLKIILLQVLPLIVLFLMFAFIIIDKQISKFNLVALSFIIGGGIGNIYDRILYNSVTDFIYLEYGFLHTGIFNMADVSVVVGSAILLVNLIVAESKKHFPKDASFS